MGGTHYRYFSIVWNLLPNLTLSVPKWEQDYSGEAFLEEYLKQGVQSPHKPCLWEEVLSFWEEGRQGQGEKPAGPSWWHHGSHSKVSSNLYLLCWTHVPGTWRQTQAHLSGSKPRPLVIRYNVHTNWKRQWKQIRKLSTLSSCQDGGQAKQFLCDIWRLGQWTTERDSREMRRLGPPWLSAF